MAKFLKIGAVQAMRMNQCSAYNPRTKEIICGYKENKIEGLCDIVVYSYTTKKLLRKYLNLTGLYHCNDMTVSSDNKLYIATMGSGETRDAVTCFNLSNMSRVGLMKVKMRDNSIFKGIAGVACNQASIQNKGNDKFAFAGWGISGSDYTRIAITDSDFNEQGSFEVKRNNRTFQTIEYKDGYIFVHFNQEIDIFDEDGKLIRIIKPYSSAYEGEGIFVIDNKLYYTIITIGSDASYSYEAYIHEIDMKIYNNIAVYPDGAEPDYYCADFFSLISNKLGKSCICVPYSQYLKGELNGTNVYSFGGALLNKYPEKKIFAGSNRYDTAKQVLDYLKNNQI